MKKFLCIILALILLSILTSCAHRKSPNMASSDTEDVTEENTLTSPETTENPSKVTEELPPVNDERSLLLRETSGCGHPHDRIFRNPVITFATDFYNGSYDESKIISIGNNTYTLNIEYAYYYEFNDRAEINYCTDDRKINASFDENGLLTNLSASGIDNCLTELGIPKGADSEAVISAVKEILSPIHDISSYDFEIGETFDGKTRYVYTEKQNDIIFFRLSFLVDENMRLINFGIGYDAYGKVDMTSVDMEVANELLKIKLEDVYQQEHNGKKILSFTTTDYAVAALFDGVEYIHFCGFSIMFEGEDQVYNDENLGILVPISLIEAN